MRVSHLPAILAAKLKINQDAPTLKSGTEGCQSLAISTGAKSPTSKPGG